MNFRLFCMVVVVIAGGTALLSYSPQPPDPHSILFPNDTDEDIYAKLANIALGKDNQWVSDMIKYTYQNEAEYTPMQSLMPSCSKCHSNIPRKEM